MIALAAAAVIALLRFGPPLSEDVAATLPAAASTSIAQPSLAILPFVDLSPMQDQAHFSDGLADQLLDSLSRVPGLQLAARTSSFAYRDRPVDIPTIGRELQVASVLEGTIRKSDGRLRLTLQLIDSSDGFHRWSRTYDRPITELFAMQDEITRAVVGALKIELLPQRARTLAQRGTDNPEAWEQYLLGSAVFSDDETSNRRSMLAYRRAIELDPQYVDAWLALADVLGHSGLYADTADEALAGKREALQAIDHALALAPRRAEAYLLRGDLLYAHWWQWQAAEADLEQALRLDGVEMTSYLLRLARLRAATGRIDEALALTERILEIDPLSSAAAPRGYHLLSAGRFDEAETLLRGWIRNSPLDEHAHYYLGLVELLQDRPREALAHFDDSAHVFRMTGAAIAWHDLGDAAASERNLQLLVSRYGHILPYQVAEVHAWRGESDLAFEWLQRAVELHDASIMYLQFDPLLGSLRNDARFEAVLRQVNLAD